MGEERSKITDKNTLLTVRCPKGVQLSAYLRRQGHAPMTPCGGHGNCGKCIVRVTEGALRISAMDRVHLSAEQLEQGYRLACQAMSEDDVTVEFLPYSAE